MACRKIAVRASAGPRTRGRELKLHAEIARTTTRTAATAAGSEFFGGIWFKIFSERGPSRVTPAP
jgi:hypothetical protein